MSGLELNYTINDTQAVAMFDRLSHMQTQEMFDDIGGYLDSETQRRFEASEDWQGYPLLSMRAFAEGGQPLIDFGHLRDSYTHNVFASGDGLEWGSDMIYSAIHHFGGMTGRGHKTEIQPNPIIGINADDEVEINGIVEDFIQRTLQ